MATANPAVGGEMRSPGSNEGHGVGLCLLQLVGLDPDPAVSGELRSLGSNESHEVGLRRLEIDAYYVVRSWRC
jgi:hypothetical protein